jgi:hypothetical protein
MKKKMTICYRCDGHGVHTNPSIYPEGGGFTQSEWDELDEFAQNTYMRGGYDVTCTKCKGIRVIPEEDEEDYSCGCGSSRCGWCA